MQYLCDGGPMLLQRLYEKNLNLKKGSEIQVRNNNFDFINLQIYVNLCKFTPLCKLLFIEFDMFCWKVSNYPRGKNLEKEKKKQTSKEDLTLTQMVGTSKEVDDDVRHCWFI